MQRKIRWATREHATPSKRLAHKVSQAPIERNRRVPRKVTDTVTFGLLGPEPTTRLRSKY